jgi:hypothetical protein
MPTDVIISAFATPPQSRAREVAQPLDRFERRPKLLGLSGIGSDVFMGPGDTERAPREPWGGKPFAREAAMYRAKGGGSVLRGLLNSQARGIEVGRIALVGFSAGGTFLSKVLENEEDRKMVDVCLVLDGLHIARIPNGPFIQQSLQPWAEYAALAMYTGVVAERGTGNRDPFLGPVFASAHTQIRQSAALEAIVGNTTTSTEAVIEAAAVVVGKKQAAGTWRAGTPKHITTDFGALTRNVPKDAFPVAIGPAASGKPTPWARTAAPYKAWHAMPEPLVEAAWGNCYAFDYGGTVAADHVLQAWHVQRALWETLLIPRWNAEVTSPYAVSGFERCCPGPGGNVVGLETPPPYWAMGVALLAGAALGYQAIR